MHFGLKAALYEPWSFLGPSLLCGAEGGGGGSGGGGNAGALSPELREAILSEMQPIITAATASTFKRLEKQLGDKLSELGKGFETKLAEIGKAKGPAEGGEGDGEGGAGKPGKQSKTDIEMAALRRQVEMATAAATEMKQHFEAERAKNRAIEFAQKTTSALGEIVGIKDPFMAKLAVSHLREEGLIAHEEDGSIVFNDANGPIPLDMGLKSWAKTETAKRFIPATGVKGSGSRPMAGGNGQTGALTPAQQLEALNDALANAIT